MGGEGRLLTESQVDQWVGRKPNPLVQVKSAELVIEMTLLVLRGGRLAEGCRVFLEQDRAASFFQGGRGRSREFDRRKPEKLCFEFRARLVTAGFRKGASVGTRWAKVRVW
jgi:hypothetical protein